MPFYPCFLLWYAFILINIVCFSNEGGFLNDFNNIFNRDNAYFFSIIRY
ncbi:predicted protein [Listeria monocytogenes J2818]|nr:predicted protein [Listeria monocytogenes J2818]